MDKNGQIDKACEILIPGIGHSTLAFDLLKQGFSNVTIADLQESEVSQKNRDFPSKIIYFDLMDASMPAQTFDCIIDSSVTDVFMQGNGNNLSNAKNVHSKLISMLKPNGKMIIFSMNNAPWKKIYNKIDMHLQFMRIQRPTFVNKSKRGRATTVKGNDVLVIVASKNPIKLAPVETTCASTTNWDDELPGEYEFYNAERNWSAT